MSERHLLVRRTAAYSALPLVSALTPLFVLPVISRASSTSEWSGLAIGQSIGFLAALLVGFGWPVLGPPKAAQSDKSTRLEMYATSLTSRTAVFVVAAPVVAAIAWFAAPGTGSARVLCLLMAVTGALSGFSIAWYCIGTGAPGMIARYEVFPRAILSVIGALGVLATGWVWLYPVGVALSVVAGVAAFSRRTLSGYSRSRHEPLNHVLRRQASATLVEASAGSYTMGGAFLTSLAAPRAIQIAEFGSGDRLNQVAMQTIVMISNAINPWVAQSKGRAFARRAEIAILIHAGLGFVGIAVLSLAGPWLSALLFSDRLAVGLGTCAAFGLYFCAVSLQTALARHVLVSRGQVKSVLVATFSGAALGVPAVLVGAATHGAVGAASGLALGETLICAILAVPATRTIRSHRAADLPREHVAGSLRDV